MMDMNIHQQYVSALILGAMGFIAPRGIWLFIAAIAAYQLLAGYHA